MMRLIKLSPVFLCCWLSASYGAIWNTEEGYIIDELPDHDDDLSTGATNACVSISGVDGKCVPLAECNPYHKMFADLEDQSDATGFKTFINVGVNDTCTPDNGDESLNYVCCTTLPYSNAKTISYNEYMDMEPDANDTLPVILPAEAPEIDLKIVRGTEASHGEFPYLVAITSNGAQFCGGSMLNAQWIMSAAHCFADFTSAKARQLVIKIGDHDIYNPTDVSHQDSKVSKIFLHPGFFRANGFFRDDVALLKLKAPVSSAGNVRSISIYGSAIDGGSQAVVAGWGKTCGQDHCPLSRVIRKATVPTITNGQCSARYQGTQAPPITTNMICAGGASGADACNGDSGGPLVVYTGGQAYQIGVVSWGIKCGVYPGVYTRITNFIGWINKHKNNNSEKNLQ